MKKIVMFYIMCFFIVASKAQNGSSPLRDNPLFIEIVEKSNELANNIFESKGKSSEKVLQAKKQVEQVVNSNEFTEQEKMIKINSILELPADKGIEFYATQFKNNWELIKGSFGEALTNDYIKIETEELMKSEAYQGRASQARFADDCRRKAMYTLCASAATSAAILCHGACVSTLWGMFACFALCGTGQTYAIAVCYDTYCAPLAPTTNN